jgi:hypothetical protein
MADVVTPWPKALIVIIMLTARAKNVQNRHFEKLDIGTPPHFGFIFESETFGYLL